MQRRTVGWTARAGRVQLYRALLQPSAKALDTGIPEPRRVRGASYASLTSCPKNRQQVTPDINPELVRAFCHDLYQVAENDLADHQIIIVDQLLVEPEDDSTLEFTQRLMTENDPENPPLISYYHAPLVIAGGANFSRRTCLRGRPIRATSRLGQRLVSKGVVGHPDRFIGLGTVPLQSPVVASGRSLANNLSR